jgi:hypothetical protein
LTIRKEVCLFSRPLLLYGFGLWIAERLGNRFEPEIERRPVGAISLALPTLLLDKFSSVFFSSVFPNIAPEAAGIFGGWMLCCCAGALLGGVMGRSKGA